MGPVCIPPPPSHTFCIYLLYTFEKTDYWSDLISHLNCRYSHFLADTEFPILKMKEPSQVNGNYYFAETKLKIKIGAGDKKCMICGKLLPTGPVISAHDPNRNCDRDLPRQTNFFPPRYGSFICPPSPSRVLFRLFAMSKKYSISRRLKMCTNHTTSVKKEIHGV